MRFPAFSAWIGLLYNTVFEITAEGLGSQDAVGAGGRYDRLLMNYGGDEKTEYGPLVLP